MPANLLAGGSASALHHRSELEIEHPKQHAAPGAANLSGLTCIRCGASYPASFEIDSRGCPACRDIAPANLKPGYAAPADPRAIAPHAPASLWRYAHALPCSLEDAVSLGEGQTPLTEAARIGRALGARNLFIKDEGRNPTWSHKDRFSTVAVSLARAQGAIFRSTQDAWDWLGRNAAALMAR